jgi:hypothetical protein
MMKCANVPMNGGISPVENFVITYMELSNDASSDVLPSLRHLDGNHHTGLQADDASTPTIPSRYWGTTYWTPTQIPGQLKSVSGMRILDDHFTYLAARVAIPMRAAAAPTAVNKHSPHIM